ncbi:MAG: prenyltransferase/squalene oxidase repeat-containing protein [Planctomycetota bacterium]
MRRRAQRSWLSAAFASAALAAGVVGQADGQGLMPRGVTEEIRAAIDRGVRYLQRSQSPGGEWRSAGGYGLYPVAMTGMAGMALVASGSTPTRGPQWRAVRRSMDWLLDAADPVTGFVAETRTEERGMFGHGFATLYLASVYGMEEDAVRQQRLHGVLTRAVRLIERAQSAAGGWYYYPDSADDEGSVTVTQMQALRACRMAGIVVDKRTVDRAVGYLRRCQNPDGGIRYKLDMRGASRPAITAAGVAVLYSAGRYDDEPFVERALRFARRHVTVSGGSQHHYYAHLYLAQAQYQTGGPEWDAYYEELAAWLVNEQNDDGAWEGDGAGPIYGTAVALTILQLPYALVPIYQR